MRAEASPEQLHRRLPRQLFLRASQASHLIADLAVARHPSPALRMASRILSRTPALASRAVALPARLPISRSFQTSSRRLQEAVAAGPVKKPVGAFRGGSVAENPGRPPQAPVPIFLSEVRADNVLRATDSSVSCSARRSRAPRSTTISWRNTRSRMRC